MYKLLLVSVIIAVTASPVAASSTNRYYDWSSTLETRQSKVLGIASPSAQKATSPSEYLQFDRYIFGGGLTPTNSFYFIKPLQENIQLTLTFNQQAKDELRVQIAGERLQEMQKLATSNNTRAITSAADAYHQAMTALTRNAVSLEDKQNTNIDGLLSQLEEETAKHNIILEQVRVQVPDQAENAIDDALEASWKSTDTIADLKDRPAVPPDLVSRLQSLKSQGLLTPEEVNKLVGVKSRVEAREEVGKYVNEGIVSESDFLRLNETAKSFYPDEFYKINETLRFQELQRLENQKPDDATLNKIQAFAKTYQPGDQVPSELRKYWVPVVRLEEIQNTLRPDLIDANLFKQNDQESKKFNEVVERFKPRPEDIAYIKNFIQKNNADVNNLPPEYQRMYNLGQKYGAQCGAGFNWVPQSQNPAGGYCAPIGSDLSGGPKYDDFTKGKACIGNIVNAKSSGGACSSYPSDCIPPGWSKADSCVATPVTTETNNKVSCPSNAHFVSVSYDPNGGYCIPNYTQAGFGQNTYNNPYSLSPLTTTPGGPYYTNSGQCGPNSNWVPEPTNPQGGYCASNSGTNSGPISPSRESQEAACRAGGGTCVSWMNEACGCERSGTSNTNPTTPYGSPNRESQEAACRSGGGTCTGWNNGACSCERSGTGNATSPTQSGNYSGSPSRESQEAACRSGGGTCVSWVNEACGCERPQNTGNNPPAGYGSCSSDQYWNGSACVTSTYTPPPSSEPVPQPAPTTPESTTPPPPAPSP